MAETGTVQTVQNLKRHEVNTAEWLADIPQDAPVRNVILMIGDGMSAEHVSAAWICNGGKLHLFNLPYTGFSRTWSANRLITDSAAGGTALACGAKTNNGMLGQTPDGAPLFSLAAQLSAAPYNKKAGLVVTKSITDATPAAFYAHTSSRNHTKKIAAQLMKSTLQVVVGGGGSHFSAEQLQQMKAVNNAHVFLAADGDCAYAAERGDFLPEQTRVALNVLELAPQGFFLMIEGSKIDSASHDSLLKETVEETLDFDAALGVVLEWMKGRTDTLLVVTSDHQTGGLVIHDGNIAKGKVQASFSTTSHNGVMVPIYAAGPGAANFVGVMENVQLPQRILKRVSR